MGRKTGKTDLASKAKYGKNDYPLVFMAHYFRYVEGLPDDVAIFNRALTEGDIAKIMDGLKQNVLSVSVLRINYLHSSSGSPNGRDLRSS